MKNPAYAPVLGVKIPGSDFSKFSSCKQSRLTGGHVTQPAAGE